MAANPLTDTPRHDVTSSMRAVVLRAPGPAGNLEIRRVPVPDPPPGSVRIAVKAFGLNRSDVHLRLGFAEGVRFPIVPGIEAVGVIDEANDTDLARGQQVAAVLGAWGGRSTGATPSTPSCPVTR